MSTLYITEYPSMPTFSGNNSIQVANEGDGVIDQTVTISGVSAQSAAFAASTRYITVVCDGIWSRKIGKNPTAATTNFRLSAGDIMSWAVQGGDKIAGITNT